MLMKGESQTIFQVIITTLTFMSSTATARAPSFICSQSCNSYHIMLTEPAA